MSTSIALRIAVAGHTNTGKTSLVRTLLRNSQFGDIDDRAGTTRHVEQVVIQVNSSTGIAVFDTPGLEDVEGLRLAINAHQSDDRSKTILRAWLSSANNPALEQEAKVLRQCLESDLIFYVLDCREQVLDKYLLELDMIAMAGNPIIPVLNFIHSDKARLADWRAALADHRMHAIVEYDTVAFDFQAEENCIEMPEPVSGPVRHARRFDKQRALDWEQTLETARRISASWLLNACSWRIRYKEAQLERAAARLRAHLTDQEQQTLRQILTTFGFRTEDLNAEVVNVNSGPWEQALFGRNEALDLGKDVGSGAGKGAALGAGIDLMVGGLSLGAATALGAVAGAGWSLFQRFGEEINARITGEKFLGLDQAGAVLIFLRQRQLLEDLATRGHASQHKVILPADLDVDATSQFIEWLNNARRHPQWSVFGDRFDKYDKARDKTIDAICELLDTQWA